MIIRYFAWIRERLNRDQQELALPESVQTVADALDHLRATDEDFAAILPPETVFRVALDDELVELDTPLGNAKELSIFPPMTGG
ncbi:MoaD/ThiS family protein [Maritalea mediterranea]|uniref:MoaD/ThiS family protein n=1 Tax=Maritalea mediterranea TaxID=2909667 RepID=A0ABS9EA26_9HYPH|nr:MoaD/ThiS family protein [Maritalea mediterranea]MCF4099052.1 MoaD/ThiS family protein [Maritalea mediterranea]